MLVATNLKRQGRAGRLEVALHADFELPFAIQRRRVDDRVATCVDIPAAHGIDMPLSGTVTALAVDAFRQVSELGSGAVVLDRAARVGVVARHAPVVDDAT